MCTDAVGACVQRTILAADGEGGGFVQKKKAGADQQDGGGGGLARHSRITQTRGPHRFGHVSRDRE